jgi:hypothetical protein
MGHGVSPIIRLVGVASRGLVASPSAQFLKVGEFLILFPGMTSPAKHDVSPVRSAARPNEPIVLFSPLHLSNVHGGVPFIGLCFVLL